jgi:hypothetical protein
VWTTKDKPFDPELLLSGLERLLRAILRLQPVVLAATAPCGGQNRSRMNDVKPREFFIQGVTRSGKTFRPSDWAERLAGALSAYRPGPKGSIGAHIGYSPYCIPKVIDNVKCVVVDERLRGIEPMAWDFVMNFAKDNELVLVEACLLPEPAMAPPPQQQAANAPVWRVGAARSS